MTDLHVVFLEEPPGHDAPKPNPYNELADFLSSEEGLALNRAFARIRDAKVRRRLTSLVELLGTKEDALQVEGTT